ncbi:hypothetical protein COU49_00705 [Candidatus Nomurabacteria bacterium CG10_big_fil_rev_8_21_14_0_10_35_16]|uniref:IPT/TIG domain-containing protein n=1 Tax=Candidatus Nomurabacteria bacterium CG10_big_fil_rev_8_21_14_0_10_35_16 TaxID=1974731 RepID=A0A2H0TC05_9BACT|nr:MAG: hypothetical protein COU49_00705 [Candidatus Nomurabacteria bacterium CG10_big_fil_rev_8_21_14_0_10_35_16]
MNQDVKKIVKIVALVFLFIFIVTYTFFNAKDLIFGVKIKDVKIESEIENEPNIVKITGNAKNAKKLTLNGREISIDQAGNFNETIALLVGYNIVTIRAEDKFGYEDEKDYQLIGTTD